MKSAAQLKSAVARLGSLRDIDFTQEDDGEDTFTITFGDSTAIFLTQEETVDLAERLNRLVGAR